MPKYIVHMSQVVSLTVQVEAETPEDAAENAWEHTPGGICAQCSGYGRDWSRDDSAEFEVDLVTDEAGAEVWDEGQDWVRRRRAGA